MKRAMWFLGLCVVPTILNAQFDVEPHRASSQRLIRAALERFDGNRRRAAEALNISPVTLWRKMKEYGLTR